MVFNQESLLLNDGKHRVKKLAFQNKKGFRGLWQFLWYPWNLKAANRVKQAIKEFKPDLIHIHNIHYAIGPLAIRKIHQWGIPMVWTLHNYRLLCPSATLYHEGELFTSSLSEKFPWTAVRKGVWSQSTLKTFWLALTYYMHNRMGTWNLVDRYFVLTEFAQTLFKSHCPCIDPNKWIVKPNFTEAAESLENIGESRKPEVSVEVAEMERDSAPYLFVGRLSLEKGVHSLIDTFIQLKKPLRIAGDGPLRAELEAKTHDSPHIEFLGAIDAHQVRTEMKNCQALIFPSQWYEGMPITLLEAFSCGTAILASRLGAMETMIQHEKNGLLFPLGEKGLTQAILHWEQCDSAKKQSIRTTAYETYLKQYSPEANKKRMLDHYQELIIRHQGRPDQTK